MIKRLKHPQMSTTFFVPESVAPAANCEPSETLIRLKKPSWHSKLKPVFCSVDTQHPNIRKGQPALPFCAKSGLNIGSSCRQGARQGLRCSYKIKLSRNDRANSGSPSWSA